MLSQFVSDKYKRIILDHFHVHNPHTAIRYAISEYKKLFIEETVVAKGCNEII